MGTRPTVHDRHSAPSSTALSSGAEGRNADAACGAPDGYQPSAKYCRTSARLPATTGAAMEVPRCIASAHVCAPSGLHPSQGLAHIRTLPDQRQATRHERCRHEHAALHHQRTRLRALWPATILGFEPASLQARKPATV